MRQTQHLQNYTFAQAWGSELCSAFPATGGGGLSDPSGVKQQRISAFWLLGSGEAARLWHSCTDTHIPKSSVQRRGTLTATWALSPPLAPKDLPAPFLLLTRSTALPGSVLQLSTLVSATNSLNTYLPGTPVLAIFFRLAFRPTLSATLELEHDGSWSRRHRRGGHLLTCPASSARTLAFLRCFLIKKK